MRGIGTRFLFPFREFEGRNINYWLSFFSFIPFCMSQLNLLITFSTHFPSRFQGIKTLFHFIFQFVINLGKSIEVIFPLLWRFKIFFLSKTTSSTKTFQQAHIVVLELYSHHEIHHLPFILKFSLLLQAFELLLHPLHFTIQQTNLCVEKSSSELQRQIFPYILRT